MFVHRSPPPHSGDSIGRMSSLERDLREHEDRKRQIEAEVTKSERELKLAEARSENEDVIAILKKEHEYQLETASYLNKRHKGYRPSDAARPVMSSQAETQSRGRLVLESGARSPYRLCD